MTTTTLNLKHYRPDDFKNFDWYEQCEREMGEDVFRRYVNRVWGVLLALPIDGKFFIEKMVEPENYEMFVKVACLFMFEDKTGWFEFNEEFTVIKRYK